MSAIDDPIAAVKQQYDEEPSGPFSLAIKVLSQLHPFSSVCFSFKEFFSQKSAGERVKALFEGIEWYVRDHDKRIENLEDKLTSPKFLETILVGVNKTFETGSIIKVRRFAAILGHEAINECSDESLEDAAAFIRTLDELGEKDIKAFGLLYHHQSQYKYQDHNLVIEQYRYIVPRITESGFSKDEFYSRCSRLSGYGLVLQLEVRGNITAIPAGEYAFRITEVGEKLGKILLSAKDKDVFSL